MKLNLATQTVNQDVTTSQKTATITFWDAHQGDISKEIQGERIGRSNSEVQVKYCFE